MYDINVKVIKKGNGFYLIFLLFGLVFLIVMGGIIISSNNKINSMDSQTTSTRVDIRTHVSDGTRMYSPVYYYEVDGKEYSCNSSSSSSTYPSEKNGIVYYDSKNPSKCMTEYSKKGNNIILIFMIIPILFIGLAVINMIKISKRVKAVQELNKKGKLVKNLPYRLEDTGMTVNNVRIQRPVVDYTLPSGSIIKLLGDPRHDKKSADSDGMVDLVIDENNPDNYFIDFEINRLTGNLPQDFYISNNQSQQTQNQYQQTNMSYQNSQQNYPQQNVQQPYSQQGYPSQQNQQYPQYGTQQGYPQQNMNDSYNQSPYNYNDINRPL